MSSAPTPELEILAPVAKGSGAPPSQWEEFTLSNVRVERRDPRRRGRVPESLLKASVSSPVCVMGRLSKVEPQQSYIVLDTEYLQKDIVIEPVTKFAYGQYRSGEVALWAAGSAGWFLLEKPSARYKRWFDGMEDSVNAFYLLADLYEKSGRGRRPGTARVFEEILKTNKRLRRHQDVIKFFDEHHVFFLTQMLEGKEGIAWTETPIFDYLARRFPEDWKQLRRNIDGETDSDSSEADASSSEESPTHSTTDDETSSEQEETEEESGEGSDEDMNADMDDSDDNARTSAVQTQAYTIFQLIVDLKDEGLMSKNRLRIRRLAEELTERFHVPDVDYALRLITARSKEILETMSYANFDWSSKIIYKDLKKCSRGKKGLDADILTEPLRWKGQITADPESKAESSSDVDMAEQSDADAKEDAENETESTEEPVRTPRAKTAASRRSPRTRRSVRRSILRLKGSEFSGKATKHGDRRGSTPAADDSDDNGALDPDSPSEHASRQILSEAFNNVLVNKQHSHSPKPDDDEVMDLGEQQDHHDSDTWICHYPGCNKTILKKGTGPSKSAIKIHSETHKEEQKTQLDLILQEQRHYLPVSNLLQMVKGFKPSGA